MSRGNPRLTIETTSVTIIIERQHMNTTRAGLQTDRIGNSLGGRGQDWREIHSQNEERVDCVAADPVQFSTMGRVLGGRFLDDRIHTPRQLRVALRQPRYRRLQLPLDQLKIITAGT